MKKNQTDLKNTIKNIIIKNIKIKNTLEVIKSRLDDTEEWICELEDKVPKIS